MNSHEYRKLFDEMCKTAGLTAADKFKVMALAVAVKNKGRILSAIDKFADKTWHKTVRDFFVVHTVQFVPEMRAGTATKFPVVNIPTQNPTMAAVAWVAVYREAPVTALLETLFAAQFFLDKDAQAKQEKWERTFWEDTVTYSTGNSSNYKAGFHAKFYENKAADKYPLMLSDMKTIYKMESYNNNGYSAKDLEEYVMEMRLALGIAKGKSPVSLNSQEMTRSPSGESSSSSAPEIEKKASLSTDTKGSSSSLGKR